MIPYLIIWIVPKIRRGLRCIH